MHYSNPATELSKSQISGFIISLKSSSIFSIFPIFEKRENFESIHSFIGKSALGRENLISRWNWQFLFIFWSESVTEEKRENMKNERPVFQGDIVKLIHNGKEVTGWVAFDKWEPEC